MELDDFFYEFITPVINIYKSPYIPKSSTILKSYYNLNLFKSFTNKEWITILVYLILGPIVFYLIDFITKIVLKNKAKDLKKDI